MKRSFFYFQYCARCQLINRLTSSKNERIAMRVIWDAVWGHHRASAIILNEEFERAGIAGRKSINLAVNRLADRGLVVKVRELTHSHAFDVYRYSPLFRGVVIFLELQRFMNESEREEFKRDMGLLEPVEQ
jgi:mannitol-specific phosphotransferase system IIBC component